MKNLVTVVLLGVFWLLILVVPIQAQKISFPDALGQQGFKLDKSQVDGVEVSFSISEFSLDNISINGENMLDISLYGNFLFNDEGAPNLPGNGRIIAIPNGCVPELEVVSVKSRRFQDVAIAPAPRIPKDDEKGPLQYQKDEKVYTKDALYPSETVTVSSLKKIRGVDAVILGITPFQYNPVTKELIVYWDIKVKIKFNGGSGYFGDSRLRSRWWDPILEDAVFNFNSLPEIDYSQHFPASGLTDDDGAEYLIIAPDGPSFIQYADSIKKFRTEQGILTLVKTLSQVGGNTTTAIENYINNAYNTWTIPPAAILLLGDYGSDINSTVISPIYDDYCASDNIYGDVDEDQLPDIVMARITANNQSQLQVMVSKFLNYERNPPTSAAFYDHPITALGWQTERWFQICSETVGGFWKNVQGKNPVRINEIYSGTPGASWSTATNTATVVNYFGPSGLGYIPTSPATLGGWSGGSADDINAAINAGSFMLQHRDHGGETGWGEPAYSSSNINGLTNTDLTFIMSINCLTGKYNYSSEVFAEKFHRYTYNGQNSGALGIMAASEVSYSFVNDTYVWGMYDNMWPDFMPAYGTTPGSRGILPAFGNAAGKIFLQQSGWPYNTGDKEVTFHLFHHHGDAFLTVYSEVPQNLTVSHSPVLHTGNTSFSVSADMGSLIALTVNGEIIGTATGTGSPVTILIPVQVPPNQVIVTVTKQNYFRYRSVVDVVSATGPYVVYTSGTIDDPLPNGNNNGLMDYNETDLLNVSLKNVGVATANNVVATLSTTDTYITLTDDTENYGNVAPDQTVTQTSAFSFTVANNIPDQHLVAFDLSATNGTDSWVSHFNITANAPVLSLGSMIVQDNGPGCNNDGILDPGETANLVIANSNTGHSSLSGISASLSIVGGTSPYLTLNSNSFDIGTLAAGDAGDAVFSVTASVSTPIGTPVDLQYLVSGGSYNNQETKQLVIGVIPTYNMSSTAVSACLGNFYDPQGSAASYSDNLNITETFYPSTPGASIRFTFNSFATESGYDFLKIYNGTSITDPLIGTYSGATGPGTITASNASGALTFNFTSDGSVVAAGWSASISCYSNTEPPVANFYASSTSPAINSTITFTDQSAEFPTSWAWTFSPNTIIYMGGTNASSQNPQVQFAALGQYSVTLAVTNAYGSDIEVKSNYISVIPFTYCIPPYTTGTGSGDYITLVQLGTINNVTGASSSPYYTYYSNLSTDLNPGSVYTITLSPGTYSSGNNISVWIDYNQNGTFETSEKLGNVTIEPTPATGAINFTVPETATPGPTRMRVREVWNNSSFDACSSYGYGETEDYNVNIIGQDKTLNLTLLLEGLFNGSTMNKAQNATGNQFPGNVADQITVELRNPTAPYALAAGPYTLDLKTDGTASLSIPGSMNGNYFVIVKHRNSIETWTNSPVSFTGSVTEYNFSATATMAFGSNLKLVSGKYVIYGGDINQDGIIDADDMVSVDNDASDFMHGYLSTDVNGDGTTSSDDLLLINANSSVFVGKIIP